MANPLDQITDLINKTGDNAIILDNNGNPRYVVIDFSNYAYLVSGRPEIASLTEGEMLAKINRDIAIWKANNDENVSKFEEIEQAVKQVITGKVSQEGPGLTPAFSDNNSLNLAKKDVEVADTGETEEKYYFEPID